MSVASLLPIIRPPQKPTDLPTEDGWLAVEKQLGLSLPQDYKDFIASYGSGLLANFVSVLNPFSYNNYNLLTQVAVQRESLDAMREWGELPYGPYENGQGILLFATTDNGDTIYWNVCGPCESWSIVVNGSRDPNWEEFNLSMSDFLLKLLTEQILPKAFPSSLFPVKRTFQRVPPSREHFQ